MPTKKKHYRIKPVPVLILLLVLIGLVILGVVLATRPKGPAPAGESAPPPPSSAVSGPISSAPSEPASPAEASAGSTAQESGVSPVGGEPEDDVSSAEASSGTPPTGSAVESPADSVYQPTADFNVADYDLTQLPAGSLSDWNLILLNPAQGNKIDKELGFAMTQFDTQWVDSRAAPAYQSMVDAAKKDGITLYLRSGYRSIATQKANYDNAVQSYINQGLSRDEAVRRTNQYYTVPGHSEHHSGLAFDIITPEYNKNPHTLDDRFADTTAYAWLREHCWDYGFILRYPKEKESVTHISFEPWHYRYVGVDHAKYIRDHGLCFEEYVELLRAAGR